MRVLSEFYDYRRSRRKDNTDVVIERLIPENDFRDQFGRESHDPRFELDTANNDTMKI